MLMNFTTQLVLQLEIGCPNISFANLKSLHYFFVISGYVGSGQGTGRAGRVLMRQQPNSEVGLA